MLRLPCSVSELASSVPVSQPAVSQHLRVLKEARLVQVHKQAQQRIYSVNPERLAFTLHPGRTPDFATEVEVSFKDEAGGTMVTLIHRGWEHFGENAQNERKIHEGGWDRVL